MTKMRAKMTRFSTSGKAVRLGKASIRLADLPTAKLDWVTGDDMNKTEAHYATTVLEPALRAGDIVWYEFEPFKLRLGRKNFYTPDFGVLTNRGALQIHEVKAMWSETQVGFVDDARQKVKDASEKYPFFQFIVAARYNRKTAAKLRVEWRYEFLTPFMKKPAPGFPDTD